MKPGENPVVKPGDEQDVKLGEVVKADNDGGSYKVTSDKAGKLTVAYVASPTTKSAKVVVPAEVTIKGKTYKVTAIEDKAFINNKTIQTVTVEKNVTTIGESAFDGCTKLKTVNLKNKITEIKANAFAKCTSLKKFVIPASVVKIGKKAFYGCKNLKNITIKTTKLTKKKVRKNAFKGIHKKAKIKVPKKKLKAYTKILEKVGVNGKKQKITK